jgi:hypothetical protein
MNAAFFGLAFLAALNPELFAIDLLMENARSCLTCEAACPRVSVRPLVTGVNGPLMAQGDEAADPVMTGWL